MIVIEKQGSVLAAYDPQYVPRRPVKPPQRGGVTEFSRKSRRRMLLFLNRCDFSATRTSFLTLTFHAIPTIEDATRSFQKFMKRLRRAFPACAGIWRKEFQARGAAHYHVLLVNVPYVGWRSILRTWRECTPDHEGSIHIKLLRTHKAIIGYVAKYIAKVPAAVGSPLLDVSPYLTAAQKPSIGRSWGWINKEGLPLAQTTRILIDDPEMSASIWAAAALETNGKCGTDPHVVIIFRQDAAESMAFIMAHVRAYLPLPADRGKICYNARNELLAA